MFDRTWRNSETTYQFETSCEKVNYGERLTVSYQSEHWSFGWDGVFSVGTWLVRGRQSAWQWDMIRN
jgi:hypothetical protein